MTAAAYMKPYVLQVTPVKSQPEGVLPALCLRWGKGFEYLERAFYPQGENNQIVNIRGQHICTLL